MEVRAPEAGLQISRDTALVLIANQLLVTEHGARPITVKFLVDSQRVNGVDGHYEAEYELNNGTYLGLHFKRSRTTSRSGSAGARASSATPCGLTSMSTRT